VEMGAYAFNRSHAVAYGHLSYICAWLKAHHPFEFFAACLRHSKKGKDKRTKHEQAIAILREADREGIKFVPYDAELSEVNWTTKNGMLVGGLINIDGIAEKTAQSILKKKAEGKEQAPSHKNMLDDGATPFDNVFECRDKWGHVLSNPAHYNIKTPITQIGDIKAADEKEILLLAKIVDRNVRDHNEPEAVARRGKKMKGNTKYLQLEVEDDSGIIKVNVNRDNFHTDGKKFRFDTKLGDWFLFKCEKKAGFKVMFLDIYKKVTGNKKFEKDED